MAIYVISATHIWFGPVGLKSRARLAKFEAGALDEDIVAADLLQQYEARIAALERLVGKLSLENELLKGASLSIRQPKSATTSVVMSQTCFQHDVGPVACLSPKDSG